MTFFNSKTHFCLPIIINMCKITIVTINITNKSRSRVPYIVFDFLLFWNRFEYVFYRCSLFPISHSYIYSAVICQGPLIWIWTFGSVQLTVTIVWLTRTAWLCTHCKLHLKRTCKLPFKPCSLQHTNHHFVQNALNLTGKILFLIISYDCNGLLLNAHLSSHLFISNF